MSEAKKTIKGVDRRTIIKGAAWSVPVIAASVAAPVAAAATTPTRTPALYMGAGCIQVAGASLFPGFSVQNHGNAPFTGTVTITETIDLTDVILSATRSALWVILGVEGIAGGSSSGVIAGNWSYTGGGFLSAPTKATRTVTFSGTIPANAKANWGNLVDLGRILPTVKRYAVITSPTGAPVVEAGPRALDYQIIGTC